MRKWPILALLTGFCGPMPATDYYKLPRIERIDQDLYRSGKVMIETRECLHFPLGEEALFKYSGPGEYAIVWADHSTCDVRYIIALE